MTSQLDAQLERLSPTQQQAVQWGEGAALVLAGPGAGKTTVLTTRVARILNATPDKNFRILALTFTTKASDEMRGRVEAMVPGLADRTVIGTFHSFCATVLRRHGSHLGIKPAFGIYDQDEDRAELLRDALEQAAHRGEPVTTDDTRWLKTIDQLRSSLVSPQKTTRHFRDVRNGERVARVHAIYEEALRGHNVTDFNGMILDTCRLAHQVPAVAARIRRSYPYWLIDRLISSGPALILEIGEMPTHREIAGRRVLRNKPKDRVCAEVFHTFRGMPLDVLGIAQAIAGDSLDSILAHRARNGGRFNFWQTNR